MGVEFEHQGTSGPILDLWNLISYHLVGMFPGGAPPSFPSEAR